ncbi:MAG TPA: hypothetical protein VER96_13235 [Polyangiaceae bacterium]|nr:hypothetical protein [Polyangiaceae bacterium]
MNMPDDPERLADGASRSPLGELFASATRDLPSDEQLAKLAAALGPIMDAPAPAPSPPKSPTSISGLMKLGAVAGALAAVVGAGVALRHTSHTTPVPPTEAPKVAVPLQPSEALPTPPPSAAPPAAEAHSEEVQPSASSSSAKPTVAPAKAATEAALLEQARRALNTSPSYALQLANQHRARFPNGVLTQEREVIAIEALRRLHRSTEADQRASGFSKSFPGSAHQRMVDEAAPK